MLQRAGRRGNRFALIVGARVAQAPNDKEQLEPTLAAVRENLAPAHVLVDSGFVSEAAIRAVEQPDPDGKGESPRVLAAVKRERHGRTSEQLEKREAPPPSPDAPFTEQLAHRTATASGRALHRLRQQTVEPVFGIIKSVLGFRRFIARMGLGVPGLQPEAPPLPRRPHASGLKPAGGLKAAAGPG